MEILLENLKKMDFDRAEKKEEEEEEEEASLHVIICVEIYLSKRLHDCIHLKHKKF